MEGLAERRYQPGDHLPQAVGLCDVCGEGQYRQKPPKPRKLSSVSVHRALHTLEEGVGCPLFVHKGRNLLPLQAAWTLLEYCQDVMSLDEPWA
ncbi:hypothetical protein LNP25_22865 [Klebsiella variicola subsp. variicola]|nr:hypothetical protein [Klebsiella variicola subsp. variicola]